MTALSHAALDAIFEPRNGSTKRADTGLEVGGVDISDRYYSVTEGGTATAATTNIQSSNADISTLFAEIGTVVTTPNVDMPASVSVSGFKTFGTATGTLLMASDGDIDRQLNLGAVTDIGDWVDDKTSLSGGDFEVKVDINSGNTFTSGNGTGVWLSLSSTRSWTQSQTNNGSRTCTVTVSVREIANTSNIDTMTATVSAIVEEF